MKLAILIITCNEAKTNNTFIIKSRSQLRIKIPEAENALSDSTEVIRIILRAPHKYIIIYTVACHLKQSQLLTQDFAHVLSLIFFNVTSVFNNFAVFSFSISILDH